MTGPTVSAAPLRWRPRSFLLYGGAAALFLLGLALRNPIPLFAGLPLLLAPVATSLSSPAGALSAELVWGADGSQGTVIVRGHVAPSKGLKASELAIEFHRPPSYSEQAAPTIDYQPSAVAFELQWSTREPSLVAVEPPIVRWRDPLGLVEKPVEVVGDPLSIERFPSELLRMGAVRLRRTIHAPGETRSGSIGGSGEFFSLRPAAPTDTPRQINWRATARLGRRVSNDFYLERTGDVLLLIDARPTELGPERDERLFAVSKAAAFGIAEAFLHEKARVGVGIYEEFLTVVPLASGRMQRFRILSALRSARSHGTTGPTERCAVAARRYYPSNVTTILFSPLADEAGRALIPHLRRRGFHLVVVSPSYLGFQNPAFLEGAPVDPLAARVMRLTRRLRVGEIWRDAPVVDWEDFWSLGSFVDLMTGPVQQRGAL